VLADEIEKAKQREQIAAWDRGEAELRNGLGLDIPKSQLSTDLLARMALFSEFCAERSCRKLPAKPHTVAAFVLDRASRGERVQVVLSLLAAIEAVHDNAGLSNPTKTQAVNAALATIVKAEPPRSWSKEERAEWARLPPGVRHAISRHEGDRDRELRRKQNEYAELKRIAQTNNRKDYEYVPTAQV
jgi:hypothetical protein